MKLEKKDIQHIANLARLELSDQELDAYGTQLSNVLGYIDQLKEVDTSDEEPTAQVTGLENVFREDEVEDWDSQEILEALREAPELEDRFIKTKRVL